MRLKSLRVLFEGCLALMNPAEWQITDWMQAVGALLMSLSVTAAASWLCLTWAVFMWRVCNIRREIQLTRTDFHISQSPMRALFGLFTKQKWTLKYFTCPERCFLTDGSDFCYFCAFYLRKITVVETSITVSEEWLCISLSSQYSFMIPIQLTDPGLRWA